MGLLRRAAIGVIGLAVGLLLLLGGVAPVVGLLLLLMAGVPVRTGISRSAIIAWPTPLKGRWR